MTGGLVSTVESLDPAKLVMGLLAPVLHPPDSSVGLIDQGLGFLQEPSLDGILAFGQNLTGTLSVWLLEIATVLAAAGGLLGLATVTAPAGVAVEGLAASALAWSTVMGTIFVGLTRLKTVTDLGQAAAATTDHEQKREPKQIGEDATIPASLGLLKGLLWGLKKTLGWMRGPAADSTLSEPENLKKTEAEVERGTEEGQEAEPASPGLKADTTAKDTEKSVQAPESSHAADTKTQQSGKVTAKNHTVETNSARNPFKGKSFAQINQEFAERGFVKKGTSPVDGKGHSIDPVTNTRYFFDKGGQYADGFEPTYLDVWENGRPNKVKMLLNGDIWTPETTEPS